MNITIGELKGNALRIVMFLYRPSQIIGFRWAAVKSGLYMNLPSGTAIDVNGDYDFLLSHAIIEPAENGEHRLTKSANLAFAEYLGNVTKTILDDIIDVDYEFALLRYFDKLNDYIHAEKIPQIFLDFVPKMKVSNYSQGNLRDYLYSLGPYIDYVGEWYRISDFGKQYLTLKIVKKEEADKKKQIEKKILETTLSSSNFQQKVAIASAAIAAFALIVGALIPLYINSQNKVANVSVQELHQAIKIQKQISKDIQEIKNKIETNDTIYVQ